MELFGLVRQTHPTWVIKVFVVTLLYCTDRTVIKHHDCGVHSVDFFVDSLSLHLQLRSCSASLLLACPTFSHMSAMVLSCKWFDGAPAGISLPATLFIIALCQSANACSPELATFTCLNLPVPSLATTPGAAPQPSSISHVIRIFFSSAICTTPTSSTGAFAAAMMSACAHDNVIIFHVFDQLFKQCDPRTMTHPLVLLAVLPDPAHCESLNTTWFSSSCQPKVHTALGVCI